MRKTEASRFLLLNAAVILTLSLVLTAQVKAVWIGAEGEEWLRWNRATRIVYLRAYLKGIESGWVGGCDAGIDAVQARMNVDEATRYAQHCVGQMPISDREQTEYIESITKFYRTYPKLRYLYIADILLKLNAGLSIVQINQHYAPTSKAEEQKVE